MKNTIEKRIKMLKEFANANSIKLYISLSSSAENSDKPFFGGVRVTNFFVIISLINVSQKDLDQLFPVINKYSDKPWDWKWISINPNLTMEIINKYSDKPWDWENISNHENITMEMIEKYPHIPWVWGDYGISNNPNLTMEIIEKYPDKPWCWKIISRNPNITMLIIDKYPNKPWVWGEWGISMNPNITIEMIEKYPDKDWEWGGFGYWGITTNNNITMEFIKKYPMNPWDWGYISSNKNLTIEFLLETIKKFPHISWDWGGISTNRFKIDYEKELNKLIKTYVKEKIIEENKIQNFKKIEEELIQKTWHPSRFQKWCIDEDEKEN